MAEHTAVRNNVLPGSKRPVTSVSEVCKSNMVDTARAENAYRLISPAVMLFWRLIDLNKVSQG
jgi:hypothetical protein